LYQEKDRCDNPCDRECNFGLLDVNAQPKPAMFAVETLHAQTGTRTAAGIVPAEPSSLHAIRSDGATDSVLVLWTDRIGETLTVTPPAPAAASICRDRRLL
jgi:hypothetical protein